MIKLLELLLFYRTFILRFNQWLVLNIVLEFSPMKLFLVCFWIFPRHLILLNMTFSWIKWHIMDSWGTVLDRFKTIVLDWFKNCLTRRKQFVDDNNHTSATKHINSGMPQGSILGPLGFIIYVNDIPNSVPDLSLILYGDDTSSFT